MRLAGFLIAIVASVSLVTLLLARTDGVPAAQAQVPPDLTITKTDSPDPVMPGNNITYTIVAAVSGSASCCIEVFDSIPAGTTFVSWNQTSGTAFASTTAPPVGGTGTVTASNGSLLAGQTATFVLVVNVLPSTPNGTVIFNTANIFCTDCSEQDQTNNAFTAQTTVTVPTVTPTVTSTVTRTVTPTVTPTGTVPPTATPTRTPTVRPNVGAFLEGASGTERNLQRAGIPDPRHPVQPVPPQGQVGGTAATQSAGPAPAGVLRPPSTGDAGLVGD